MDLYQQKAMKAAGKLKKAIVTGGAGFVGSNIARFLVESGVETIVIDDLSFGVKENVPKGATLLQKDVSKLEEKDLAGVDAVFHEAGVSSITMCLADPERTVHTNIGAFFNLVDLCRKKNARIVYASTSSVYNGVTPPHNEKAKLKFKTIYEIAKFSTESMSRYYDGSIGLRYFSVYGPNERHKGNCANLVTQFLWDIKAGKSPVIYGDGTQKRDFIHVYDIAAANVLAATADTSKFSERVFNVGTGVATDLNQLVAAVNESLGKKVEAKYIANPLGSNYVYAVQADTSLSKAKLGFSSSISLAQGLQQIIPEY